MLGLLEQNPILSQGSFVSQNKIRDSLQEFSKIHHWTMQNSQSLAPY